MKKSLIKEINEKIISAEPLNISFYNNLDVLNYLKNNKVLYYASLLSKSVDTDLKKLYDNYRLRYINSIKILKEVCDKNNIDFLIYKTHKFIPDINDGDIDIIVRRNDFKKILNVFNKLDFHTVEDEPGKGKIEKDGYSTIEPHITMSWRGGGYLDEDTIWSNTIEIEEEGILLNNVSYEIEAIAIYSKILFEPSYMDLYSAKTLHFLKEKIVDMKTTIEMSTRPDLLKSVYRYYELNKILDQEFPLFLSNMLFMSLWSKNLLKSKDCRTFIKHTIYFIYWKYRYPITKKLPFTHHHEW